MAKQFEIWQSFLSFLSGVKNENFVSLSIPMLSEGLFTDILSEANRLSNAMGQRIFMK